MADDGSTTPDPIDVPVPWAQSVQQIRQQPRWRNILVLGDKDRGKSTYCRYLCQQLLESGEHETVAYVDADVGQKRHRSPRHHHPGLSSAPHALDRD